MEIFLYSVDMVVMTPDQTFQTVQATNMNSDPEVGLLGINSQPSSLEGEGSSGSMCCFLVDCKATVVARTECCGTLKSH
jgi:hypothetical protein